MGQPMQSESLHPSSVAVTSEEAGAVFQSILHFPDSVQYETRRRAPTNCCHLLPFHAILCHPIPSHARPYPAAATMLPCHDLTLMPCPYHAMTPPHALPLPSHATAAICCHPCPPMPCPYHAAATMHHTPTMPHNTTMLPCHDPPHALPPNSGNPHDGVSTVVEAQSRA
jgi:hypothetical protein